MTYPRCSRSTENVPKNSIMNDSRPLYYRCRRRIRKKSLGIGVFTTHIMTHQVNKLVTGSEAKAKESNKKKKKNAGRICWTKSQTNKATTIYNASLFPICTEEVEVHRLLAPLKIIPPTTPAASAKPPTIAIPTNPSLDTLSSISCPRLAACMFAGSLSRSRSL